FGSLSARLHVCPRHCSCRHPVRDPRASGCGRVRPPGMDRASQARASLGVALPLRVGPLHRQGHGSRGGSLRDGAEPAKDGGGQSAAWRGGVWPWHGSKERQPGHERQHSNESASAPPGPAWTVEPPPPPDGDLLHGVGGSGLYAPPSSANSLCSSPLHTLIGDTEAGAARSGGGAGGAALPAHSWSLGSAQAPTLGGRDRVEEVLVRRLDALEMRMERRLDRLAGYVLRQAAAMGNPAAGLAFLQGRQTTLRVSPSADAAQRPPDASEPRRMSAQLGVAGAGPRRYSRASSAHASRRGSISSHLSASQARLLGGARPSRPVAPRPRMGARQAPGPPPERRASDAEQAAAAG
ncbi:unnamed protein product, partial [Prorocentrum cordatum]